MAGTYLPLSIAIMRQRLLLCYLTRVFADKYGEQSWKLFSVECKDEMVAFKWDLGQKCMVVIVAEAAGFLGSFHGSPLANWEEVEEIDIASISIFKPREEGGAGFDDALYFGVPALPE